MKNILDNTKPITLEAIKKAFKIERNPMITYIIAAYDRQLDSYLRPFTAQTIGQAIRSFRDEVNRHDSELAKHPEDYELYHVGNFNETTGKVLPLEEPHQIAIASNLVEKT